MWSSRVSMVLCSYVPPERAQFFFFFFKTPSTPRLWSSRVSMSPFGFEGGPDAWPFCCLVCLPSAHLSYWIPCGTHRTAPLLCFFWCGGVKLFFCFVFYFLWHVLGLWWCSLARFFPVSALSIDVVRTPCVHSGRRPKPRQARDGHSWRMAAALLVLPAGPSSLLPTFAGGVWKAGVRLSGLSPVKAPTHSSLWFVGVPVRRAGGFVVPCRAFRCAHRVWWSLWPSSLRAGGGSADVPRHVPLPTGLVCTRSACDPRGAPGAFQGDLQRCPVLSGGGVSRFSDVYASCARSGL